MHFGTRRALTVLAVAGVLAGAWYGAHITTGPTPPLRPSSTDTAPAHAQAQQALSTPPTSVPTPPLLASAFSGPDRLDADAYAYWNKGSCAPRDAAWEVTSGAWFIHNGAGYSGKPTVDAGNSPCIATYQNSGSDTLRMNTTRNDFANTDIQFDYDLIAHGGFGGTTNSYDGLHIWTRHQSPYDLYAVSLGRWDGEMVIKKKVPVNEAHCTTPSDGGCYTELNTPVKRLDLVTPNVWRHADIQTRTLANGNVSITLYINGAAVMHATDTGTFGGSIIPNGAVGIRGDNTEFYLKNFVVAGL